MRTTILSLLGVVGVLLLVVGGVAAHDDNNSSGDHGHDDAPVDGTAAEWGAWMEQHMIDHMGAEAAAWMQDRMGMSYEEMGEHMASHQHDSKMGGMGCH